MLSAAARLAPAVDDGAGADAVVQALPIAAALFDERGELLSCNRPFEQCFSPPARLTADRFILRFERGCDAALSDNRTEDVSCPVSGRVFRLSWSRLSVPPGLRLLTAQDLGEPATRGGPQRPLQEPLLLTSRTLSVSDMATTMAHELNQPLAAIINYLGTGLRLMRGRGLPPRLLEAVDAAHAQAEHAAAVIARLREFVRTREPLREPLHLRDLAIHVLQLMQLDAQKHRVHLALDIPRDLPRVSADRVMIEQLLANLIKNALDAMQASPPGDRVVRVRARPDTDRVRVQVSDRGCGLGGGDPEQWFAPFYTTKHHGMGVGLGICRSIVEFHKGHLAVESNEHGGTTVAFSLPVDRLDR